MLPFLFLVLALGLTGLAAYGGVALVLWLARLLGGGWLEAALAVAILGVTVHSFVSVLAFCNAEPVYVPPTPEDAAAGSQGMELHNCDAPIGAIYAFYLAFICPAVIISSAVFLWRCLSRLRRGPGTGEAA